MKNRAIYFGLGLFALPLAAIWMLSNDEKPEENGVQKPTEQIKASPSQKTFRKQIKVSGIGDIKYDRVEEAVDLREFCAELIPDKPFLNSVVIKVNVYLEGDKIVHITKGKGKYPKTEDFTSKALKVMQHGDLKAGWSGNACELLAHKRNWLSINDRDQIASLWRYMQSKSWDDTDHEGEITPVHISHGSSYTGDPSNKGKVLPAFLFRTCRGITSSEYSDKHPIYPREETYLRKWSLVSFKKNERGEWHRNPSVGDHISYPEASLEAIEKWKPVFEERSRKKREERKRR